MSSMWRSSWHRQDDWFKYWSCHRIGSRLASVGIMCFRTRWMHSLHVKRSSARRIAKLDSSNNDDTMSSVWVDLGIIRTLERLSASVTSHKHPSDSNRIIQSNPINDIITSLFVGEKDDTNLYCFSNGALGRHGCIYALTTDGRVLKSNDHNSHRVVGNSVDSDHNQYSQG